MGKKVLVLAFVVFFLGLVSADITLSDPNEVYNLGDRLYIGADGLVGSNNGNFNIDLLCGNMTINMVRIPARSFSMDEEQSYSVPYKIIDKEDLEVENLQSILGTCQVSATLGANVAATKQFTITDNIITNVRVDKDAYDPGEVIELEIEAQKANGEPLEGFVQVTNATEFVKAIEEGKFKDTFAMPDTAEAGSYVLYAISYDLGADGLLNRGEATVNFVINSIPTSIIPSLSVSEVTPGEELKIGVEVFDQSGEGMSGTASVKILSPEKEETEYNLKTGDHIEVEFETNSSAGEWTMYVIYSDLVEQVEFSVKEIQKVEFDIEDSILTIVNVGNAIYNKSIKINIGEEERELDLKIGVGEIRKFNLKAPQGEYDVMVGDGDNQISRQVILTGNAISIKDLERVGIFRGYSIVWVFLIIILAAAAFIFFKRSQKTKTLKVDKGENKIISKVRKVGGVFKKNVGKTVPMPVKNNMEHTLHMTKKSPAVQSLDSKSHSHEDKTMVDMTKTKHGHAESTLVMNGEKYGSAVVCLYVKNYAKLNEHTMGELKTLVNSTKNLKGLVDWRGEYIFIVFAPLITKTYHNEELAVKTGMKLLEDIKAHNKKFKNKIEFNLGVHSGELLASKSGGKLKYTSIGNTISFAKRLANSHEEHLIVSEEIRKKMLRDLKVHKTKDIGEHHTYSVYEVKNKAASEAKLKELMKRMDNS